MSWPFTSVGQSTGLPYAIKNKRPDKKFRQGLYWGFYCSNPLEKEMATHSSTLAWKIPWTEEPVHWVAKSRTRLSDFTYCSKGK